MSRLGNAVTELNSVTEEAGLPRWSNQIHPIPKLLVTVIYTITVMSFSRYDLGGLAAMGLYPLILFLTADVPVRACFRRIRLIIPIVCVIGILNPFFDRETVLTVGNLQISGGIISMSTLIIKGVYTVLGAYLLVVTTSIEKICFALECLHVPSVIVTTILLIFRYITVLFQEMDRVMQAYALRAPGQGGVHYSVWGSLVGHMLLRSMDRANAVYESMCLRGYHGDSGGFSYIREESPHKNYGWLIGWSFGVLLLRFVPVFVLIGRLFI